eukprot:207362_1
MANYFPIQHVNTTTINVTSLSQQAQSMLADITNLTNQLTHNELLLTQMSDELRAQSETIEYYKDLHNPQSFEQWIKGIGDTKLSNEGFSETCVVPNIAGFGLSKHTVTHQSPFYTQIHNCNDKQKWSQLIEITKHERYVMINRAKFKCNQIFEYQSPSILRGNVDKVNEDDLWEEITDYDHDASLIKLTLHKNTQSVWLACRLPRRTIWNHYVSVLPLKIRSPSNYESQLRKYKMHKFDKQNMPNVILFVVDSTSRSNFHRGSVSTDDYLEQVMQHEKREFELFEFFRHSTVGWGTGKNLMGMVQGGNHMKLELDLFEFYHKMGYIVPGIEEYLEVIDKNWDAKNESNIYAPEQWDQTNQYVFYLTKNVFHFNCKHVQYYSTEAMVEFVIDAVNVVYNEYDSPLPYFMVVHMEDNHRADGWFSYVLDRYFRRLVEYFDFSNTIFHIIGDHGSLVGTSTSTQFGRWEASNPISLMFVPLNLFPADNMDILRANQQRFVTHYDFHVFFKQIPLLFTDLYGSHALEDIEWINESLPVQPMEPKRTRHRMTKMYRNIYSEVVDVNRTCAEIDAPKGFCFCDIPMDVAITPELIERDAHLIDYAVNTINNLTGNGKYDCEVLDPSQFTVTTHLEHVHTHGDIQLVLQQISDATQTSDEYQNALRKNKVLSYMAYIESDNKKDMKLQIPDVDRDGMMVPLIERLDYFKFEQCITREYDIVSFKKDDEFKEQFEDTNNDLPPVMFANMNYTKALLRKQQPFNLRLCKCKT